MDLLKKIKESLVKEGSDIRTKKIIRYFLDMGYRVSWDDGVPESWISVEGNKGFHCLVGAVFPITFLINSERKILEKYKNIENEFLIVEIEDYDSVIWEISDIEEFIKICKERNMYVDKKNLWKINQNIMILIVRYYPFCCKIVIIDIITGY